MFQREGERKASDGSAGGTGKRAEAIPWKASEKYPQFWQLLREETLFGHSTEERT